MWPVRSRTRVAICLFGRSATSFRNRDRLNAVSILATFADRGEAFHMRVAASMRRLLYCRRVAALLTGSALRRQAGSLSVGETSPRAARFAFLSALSLPLTPACPGIQCTVTRTEQLAMANAEACRAKAGQRIAEGILADERRMREDECRVRAQVFLPQNI